MDVATMPPDTTMTGKDFENIVVKVIEVYRADRVASFHRPGIHAIPMSRFEDGTVRARLIQSLPDFQGVFGRPQREAITDTKVCSQASWPLAKYRKESNGARQRQLQFMYERASFGSVCFFLLHWNKRELKTKTIEPATFAFPVSSEHPFWRDFEYGSETSITRQHCVDHAVEVPWVKFGDRRKLLPDFMSAVATMLRSEEPQRHPVAATWKWTGFEHLIPSKSVRAK